MTAMFQSFRDSTSCRCLAVKILIAAMIGGSLLGLAGLTLTGAVMTMVIATPVLVLFSPIVVPSAGLVTLVTTGFLFSGCCLVAAMLAMVCIYLSIAGKKGLVEEQMGCLGTMIGGDVKEREPVQGSLNSA